MLMKLVEHHPERNCFTIPMNGKESILQYRYLGTDPESPEGVEFTRTFVPEELRGQGLAEALVRRGLAWARAEDFRISASCWYVEKFLR